MKKLLAAAAFAAASASPAFAQDAVNFNGPWLGATVGYDKVSLEVDGDSGSEDGVLYGLSAGYDINTGSMVFGVEAELTDSTTKETASDIFVAGDSAKLSAGRDIYAGVRFGVPVSPEFLIYAKGGYTNARAKLTYDDGVDVFSESDTLDGYRIGGGVEWQQNNTFARIEYRYSDYGEYEYQGVATGIEASRHQVAVTGGWRF